MPKPTKGPRIGGSPAHQRLILANLASQLFEHGKITTTEVRAKRVQPLAERLISKAKRGDLHNRRQVMRIIRDKGVVHTLFAEIAPAVEGRNGGYTRITKIGNRRGDSAPMAVIELVQEPIAPTTRKPKAKKPAPAKAPAKDYGEGSYVGSEPPKGFEIKGNADSMKFHTPESPWYKQTKAEVWFDTPEHAAAAGFVNAQGGTDSAEQDSAEADDAPDQDSAKDTEQD